MNKKAGELTTKKLQRDRNEITIHAVRKDTEKLFKKIFKNNYAFKSHKSNETCEPSRLKEHFENTFNSYKIWSYKTKIAGMPQYMKHLQEIYADSMRIISAYAPTEAANDTEKKDLF